jgi:glycosyltransferase involved in cell wall biosynthesis
VPTEYAAAELNGIVSDSAGAAPLLLHVFPTFNVGGAQVRFVQLANSFGRSFSHRLFAMDGQYGCRERLSAELDIDLVEITVTKGNLLRNATNFRRVIRKTRPQFLVTYNWGAIEWAIANWPPLARHIHIEDGFGPEETSRQLPRRVWTRRLALRQSTVVLPSQTLVRIAADTWRLRRSQLRYIPNGVDCARFAEKSPRATAMLPWRGPDPVIGTVAALRPEKNIKRLVRAARQVLETTPCRLVIVGDGPDRSGLESLTAELGMTERVFFAGYVPDPIGYYASFDIVALSSDTEQMPYTVIEAMAAGLAIAATDVGDIPQMVSSENLPFLAPRDDDALAGALRGLLQDRNRRIAVGEANRQKAVKDYDERTMFAAYNALFEGKLGIPDREPYKRQES